MAIATKTAQTQITELYLGFFGRAPDADGFGYWAQRIADGLSPMDIAKAFAATPEFVSTYGGLTAAEMVHKLYINIGLNADPTGEAYWTDQINTGKQDFASAVWNITNSAYLQVGTHDALVVQNKVQVGMYFAGVLGSNDTDIAQLAYTNVTTTQASVDAAKVKLAIETAPTYTLDQAINLSTELLPGQYALSDAKAHLGNALTVANEVVLEAKALTVFTNAMNDASLVFDPVYTLRDTYANIVASPTVVTGADSYALSDATVAPNLGSNLSVAVAQSALAAAQAVVNGASNHATVPFAPVYTVQDSLVNISANADIVAGHAYTLTDAAALPGVVGLGVISAAQASIVAGATNAAHYSYTIDGTIFTLDHALALTGATPPASLPPNYTLSDATAHLGSDLSLAQAATQLAQAQALVAGAVNHSQLTLVPVYTLYDTYEHIQANSALVAGAQSYALSDVAVAPDFGTGQTVASIESQLSAAMAIVNGASNHATVPFAPVYTVLDSLVHINADPQIVFGHTYTLTNPNGGLGVISAAAAAIVAGASNAGSYTYTVDTNYFTLDHALALDPVSLPDSYTLSDATAHLGSNLSISTATTDLAYAQSILAGADNASALTLVPVFTILDSLQNVSNELDPLNPNPANSIVAKAASYALTNATINLGSGLTVAAATSSLAYEANIVRHASNHGDLVLQATYTLNDTLAHLAANSAILAGATSYTLSNTPGDLGNLTAAQAAIVAGAADANTYDYVIVETLTTGDDTVSANVYNGSLTPFYYDGKGPTLNSGDVLVGAANNSSDPTMVNVLNLYDGYGTGTDIIPAGVVLQNIQEVNLITKGNAGQVAALGTAEAEGNSFDTSSLLYGYLGSNGVASTNVISYGSGNDAVKADAWTLGGDDILVGGLPIPVQLGSDISVIHNNSRGGVITLGGVDVLVATAGNGGVQVGGTIDANVDELNLHRLPTGDVEVWAGGSLAGAGEISIIGGQNVSAYVTTALATGNITIGNVAGNMGVTDGTESTAVANATGDIEVISMSTRGVTYSPFVEGIEGHDEIDAEAETYTITASKASGPAEDGYTITIGSGDFASGDSVTVHYGQGFTDLTLTGTGASDAITIADAINGLAGKLIAVVGSGDEVVVAPGSGDSTLKSIYFDQYSNPDDSIQVAETKASVDFVRVHYGFAYNDIALGTDAAANAIVIANVLNGMAGGLTPIAVASGDAVTVTGPTDGSALPTIYFDQYSNPADTIQYTYAPGTEYVPPVLPVPAIPSEFISGNVVTIFGGDNVDVRVKGDKVIVGDVTASAASNEATGNITVENLQAVTFDGLTGKYHTNKAGGTVEVYGGQDVTIVSNTGGPITVGIPDANPELLTGIVEDGFASVWANPTGAISVVDESSDKNGAFGIGQYTLGYDEHNGDSYNVSISGGYAEIGSGDAVTVVANGGGVRIGGYYDGAEGTTLSNPNGSVSVTQNFQSHNEIEINGGNGITVLAKGQTVEVGEDYAVAGDVNVTQASTYTGNALGSRFIDNEGFPWSYSTVTVNGGENVTVNTTGGAVFAGWGGSQIIYGAPNGELPSSYFYPHEVALATGDITITNTFSGAGSAAGFAPIVALGGNGVTIDVVNTSDSIVWVGTDIGYRQGMEGGWAYGWWSEAGPVLNAAGTALAVPEAYASGDVVISNDTEDSLGNPIYGLADTIVRTNGSQNVVIHGGSVEAVVDVNQFIATGGKNAGNAVGESSLANVVLDGVRSNLYTSINGSVVYGVNTVVNSGALSHVTIANSLAEFDSNATQVTTTPYFTTSMASQGEHELTLTLSNNTNLLTSFQDETATKIMVDTNYPVLLGAGAFIDGIDAGPYDVGTPNFINLDADNATELDFNISKSLTVNNLNAPELVLNNVATIMVSGDGQLTLGDWTDAQNLTLIDATGSTGGVRVGITGSFNVPSPEPLGTYFKGGDGNDLVFVAAGAGLLSNKQVDGGGGTQNLVVVQDAQSAYGAGGVVVPTDPVFKAFTNFQYLGLANYTAQSYDVSGFDGVLLLNNNGTTMSSGDAGETLQIVVDQCLGSGDQTNVWEGASLDVTVGMDEHYSWGFGFGQTQGIEAGTLQYSNLTSVTVESAGLTSGISGWNAIELNNTGATATTSLDVKGHADIWLSNATGSGDNAITSITVENTGSTELTDVTSSGTGLTVKASAGAGRIHVDLQNVTTGSSNAMDTVTTGAGGGEITFGYGTGLPNLPGFSGGYELANLGESKLVRDILIAPDVQTTGFGTRAGVNDFQLGDKVDASDVLEFNDHSIQIIANDDEVILYHSGDYISSTSFGSGDYTTTYSISNGLVTYVSTTKGTLVTNTERVKDTQWITANNSGIGADVDGATAAITAGENTYVVINGSGDGLGGSGDYDTDTVIQLNNIKGVKGFGAAAVNVDDGSVDGAQMNTGAGSNTIMIYGDGVDIATFNAVTVTTGPRTGSNTVTASPYNVDGYTAVLNLKHHTGVTNSYTGLASWATIAVAGDSAVIGNDAGGDLTVDQVGDTSRGLGIATYSGDTTISKLTVDATELFLDSGSGLSAGFLKINSLVASDLTTIKLTDEGHDTGAYDITVGAITAANLQLIDASNVIANDVYLGTKTSIAIDDLIIQGGGGLLTAKVAGDNNEISASMTSLAGVDLFATGDANIINLGKVVENTAASGDVSNATINKLTATGDFTEINLGVVMGGVVSIPFGSGDCDLATFIDSVVISGNQEIHTTGVGTTVTFETATVNNDGTNGDGTGRAGSVYFTGDTVIDGGRYITGWGLMIQGVGDNTTINLGNYEYVGMDTLLPGVSEPVYGSATVYVTGVLYGNQEGGAMTTLTGVDLNGTESIVLHNIAADGHTRLSESLAAAGDVIETNISGVPIETTLANAQVNVALAGSLEEALDIAAAVAAASQGASAKVAGLSGVIDWFQFGGDTYIVEVNNLTTQAAANPVLDANDAVVKIVGLVDLSTSTFNSVTGELTFGQQLLQNA